MEKSTAEQIAEFKAQKAANEAQVAGGPTNRDAGYQKHLDKRAKEGKAKPVKATKKVPSKKKTLVKKTKGESTGGIRALEEAKIRYKKNGDVTNCGDWLAKLLKEAFVDKEGFDYEGFVQCCKENGLDLKEKWATNKNAGWRGRYRMNARQKMESVIAEEGFLLVRGKKETPPKAFLKLMQDRHGDEDDEGEE